MVLSEVSVRRVEGPQLTHLATTPTLSYWPSESRLEARAAHLQMLGDGLHLEGAVLSGGVLSGQAEGIDVELVADGGVRGEAHLARYLRAEGVVDGDAGVRASQPGLSLDAGSFRVDLKQRVAEFGDAVTRTGAVEPQ